MIQQLYKYGSNYRGIRMSSIQIKKGLLASAIAVVLGSCITLPLSAAEDVAEDEQVIVITGIRGSLKASINSKRLSNSVVDVVTAEDVGKFPDSDVGEALGRMPGVAVNRQFGQGQQVSIRGASGQLTRTLLNGHTVASTGWYDQQAIDRSFNYTLMPAEMVGGIEVYKSSQADITEGGIGGTIIINTRKPLDLESGTVFGSIKGDYGTISKATDPQLSGLYSWKNDEDTFGFLVSASVAETDYQRNGIESYLAWGEIVPTTFQQDRERTALNLVAQYSPSDSLDLGLNLMSLELDANNANTSIFLFPSTSVGGSCDSVNAADVCTYITNTGVDDYAWAQTWARQAKMVSDTVDFNFTFQAENYTLEGRIGNTKSNGGTDLTANYGGQIGQSSDFAGTYDATGNAIKIDIANQSFTAADFAGDLSSAAWASKKQPNSDEETYAQFDFTVPVEFGAINSIKTGIRYASHNVKQETDIANDVGIVASDASTFYSGTVSAGGGFLLPQPIYSAMINDAFSYIDSYSRDKSGYGTVAEENLAIYAMADFEGDGVRGNIGLRYISTDVESDYYALDSLGVFADSISTDKADYSEVLPSMNIIFDLTDDIILRASAAQVISRPNYSELFATSSMPGLNDGTPGNEKLVRGGVALDPFKATQADLSFEWYFSDNGMFSATYFIKDVSSFITTRQLLQQQIGIEDNDLTTQGFSACGDGIYDCWTVSEKYNANGGEISGIEFQLINSFDSGYGYSVNYTYADGSSPKENYPDLVGVFSDSSKHTLNMVGYYETDDFKVRLAYNWRSEYMIRELPGFYGNRQHQDYGTLDLSASYALTDNIDLMFEAVNITEEDSLQLGISPVAAEVAAEFKDNYPAWSFDGEARYRIGINLRY